MLSGENGLLKRAGNARDDTIVGQEKEQVELAYISAAVKKLGNTVDKDDLQDELDISVGDDKTLVTGTSTLNAHFYDTNHNYSINNGTVTRIADGEVELHTSTLGENYQDSWIGKTIEYKSEKNNVNEWIILGKQINEQGKNDIIITTKNTVSTKQMNYTLEEWCNYKNTLNATCKSYVGETGILGTKSATVKEIRSITIEDINTAIGFTIPETFDEVVFGVDNNFAYPKKDGSGWIKNTDSNYLTTNALERTYLNNAYEYYSAAETYKYSSSKSNWYEQTLTATNLSKPSNMVFVLADLNSYWVASYAVDIDHNFAEYGVGYVEYGHVCNGYNHGFCQSGDYGNFDRGDEGEMAIRPVVVLSSEIPWEDVEDLIGNYASYSDNGAG